MPAGKEVVEKYLADFALSVWRSLRQNLNLEVAHEVALVVPIMDSCGHARPCNHQHSYEEWGSIWHHRLAEARCAASSKDDGFTELDVVGMQ